MVKLLTAGDGNDACFEGQGNKHEKNLKAFLYLADLK